MLNLDLTSINLYFYIIHDLGYFFLIKCNVLYRCRHYKNTIMYMVQIDKMNTEQTNSNLS